MVVAEAAAGRLCSQARIEGGQAKQSVSPTEIFMSEHPPDPPPLGELPQLGLLGHPSQTHPHRRVDAKSNQLSSTAIAAFPASLQRRKKTRAPLPGTVHSAPAQV